MTGYAYCIIMTTTNRQSDADQLAKLLVSEKLAACVQVLPITSYYAWEDALQHDSELLLLIKTRSELYHQVEAAILKHHSYEVPEIIQLPISEEHPSYLQWMVDHTAHGDLSG